MSGLGDVRTAAAAMPVQRVTACRLAKLGSASPLAQGGALWSLAERHPLLVLGHAAGAEIGCLAEGRYTVG